MRKRIAALFLCLTAGILFLGCQSGEFSSAVAEPATLAVFDEVTETATDSLTQETAAEETEESEEPETSEPAAGTDAAPETAAPDLRPENETLPASVEKDGSYTTPEDVAAYIHTFGTLPGNYITKKEAQALGWNSAEGNLWDVAPGMSIGGDRFGNREGLLPDGDYRECDVNYNGGYRGAQRLIFGTDGSIYYTDDHYKSFTQLY